MIFKCRVCEEKDKRIADLAEQVEFLRRLALPPRPDSASLPLVELEANAILNGSSDPILVDPTSQSQEEIDSEAARLLSGQY